MIQSGDTFGALATRYLGNSKYADLIGKANPGADPRRLKIGSKINIPAAPAPPANKATGMAPSPRKDAVATTSEPQTPGNAKEARQPMSSLPPIPPHRAYTVEPGQRWFDLAKKFLNDGNRWPELYELNRERVVRDPDRLRAGTVIELPAGVSATTKPS